jgi:hypothetical protein
MTGKALVKVTLNEATDPDLFAYIKQFDNERMRAGALRALARAALNGGGPRRVEPTLLDSPSAQMTDAPTPRRFPDATDMVESDPAPTLSTGAPPAAAVQPAQRPAADASVTGVRRFDTDAIADQFAGF